MLIEKPLATDLAQSARVLKAITDGKIYRPSYFKADVPEAVETILMRALEKDPAARYESAADLADVRAGGMGLGRVRYRPATAAPKTATSPSAP